MLHTISEETRRCQSDVHDGTQMVEHSYTVALFLCMVDEHAHVLTLTAVGDARAQYYREVICLNENVEKDSCHNVMHVGLKGYLFKLP